MQKAWHWQDQKLILCVRLTPGAASPGLGPQVIDDAGAAWLRATVRERPEKGKANTALIKLLSKACGIPKRQIELSSGQQSRMKRLMFHDVEEPSKLEAWLDQTAQP